MKDSIKSLSRSFKYINIKWVETNISTLDVKYKYECRWNPESSGLLDTFVIKYSALVSTHLIFYHAPSIKPSEMSISTSALAGFIK